MLTTIREKTQGIIAAFILALIGIPFALWGINSYFERGSQIDVATVNGQKISEQSYRTALAGFRRQLDPRLADNPEIKRLVIDSLIDRSLLARDAEDQGYRVGSERLAKTIRQLPYFQTNGRFDAERYASLLRREGIGVSEFEQQQRAEAVKTQIQAGFSESGIVTETEVAALVRLLNQEREIAYAVISSDKFLATAAVTPEAVEQYYNAKPELFTIPEQVRIDYLRLSASEFSKGYQPTVEELRRAYAEDSAKSVRPELRRASHILISLPTGASEDDVKKALGKIQEIEKQARSGADFAKLARRYSDDKDSGAKGGDVGEVRPGVLPKPLEQALASLKIGQVSRPVRTEFGYHLAKLTDYKPGAQKSFEEMKPMLVKQLRQRKSEEGYFEASEKFRNLVYEQPDSLAPTAEALGLKAETSDWFNRNSGGSGVAAHPRVVEAAFSPEVLTQGRNSDAIEISGDTLVAIRVTGHRPATVKPLTDVRAQIEHTLKQRGAQQAARELGEKLTQALAAGQTLDAVARSHGLAFHGPKWLLRDQPQNYDQRVVEAGFRAGRPEAGKPGVGGVELGTQGYAVYTVRRVKESGPASADATAKARQLLATRRGPDYYTNYRSGLKQKSDVQIHQDKL